MGAVLVAAVASMASLFRSRRALQLEVLALRHQLAVYHRTPRRPRLRPADRLLWAWLARAWPGWREALVVVQPQTVIAWQRKRFREHWTRLSQHGTPGRPPLAKELRDLIRTMSTANPTWGSPRIVGELRKLGIELAKATVERYMVRRRTPPSPTWRAFLATHAQDLVSIDFFTVATVRFEILFVLLIFAHDRRRMRHFNITTHPTAEWTAQQDWWRPSVKAGFKAVKLKTGGFAVKEEAAGKAAFEALFRVLLPVRLIYMRNLAMGILLIGIRSSLSLPREKIST